MSKEIYNHRKKNGCFISKLSNDMIIDLKNNIRCIDFCKKYLVCKKTYYNYKIELGLDTKLAYRTKVNLEDYKIYRLEHTRKEAAEHFNISVDLTYDYDNHLGIEYKKK